MARRLVLFSQPSLEVFEKLESALFPKFLKNPILAYMPSDGSDTKTNAKYTPLWQSFAATRGAAFYEIDNSKRGEEVYPEKKKLLSANILLITGGNTFTLLNHLRLSGLNQAVKEFWQKDDIVLSGFSAGALVLSPSIRIAKSGDPNLPGLTDLRGLNIFDFEVWPHYTPSQESEVKEFLGSDFENVRFIGDNDLLIIDSP